MKSFKLWIEEKDNQKRIKSMLLSRLGFTNHAMDDSTVELKDIDKKRLIHAFSSIGLGEDDVSSLKSWVNMYPHSTLQELLAQMDGMNINASDEEEPDYPSQPGQLPAGQPKPQPKQMIPQNPPSPMMGGGF